MLLFLLLHLLSVQSKKVFYSSNSWAQTGCAEKEAYYRQETRSIMLVVNRNFEKLANISHVYSQVNDDGLCGVDSELTNAK